MVVLLSQFPVWVRKKQSVVSGEALRGAEASLLLHVVPTPSCRATELLRTRRAELERAARGQELVRRDLRRDSKRPSPKPHPKKGARGSTEAFPRSKRFPLLCWPCRAPHPQTFFPQISKSTLPHLQTSHLVTSNNTRIRPPPSHHDPRLQASDSSALFLCHTRYLFDAKPSQRSRAHYVGAAVIEVQSGRGGTPYQDPCRDRRFGLPKAPRPSLKPQTHTMRLLRTSFLCGGRGADARHRNGAVRLGD